MLTVACLLSTYLVPSAVLINFHILTQIEQIDAELRSQTQA